MASMAWHNDVKRWRIFWHVTLTDGKVIKGSKSFKRKSDAEKFLIHIEKNIVRLKNDRQEREIPLTEAVAEWKQFIRGFTERSQHFYISGMRVFLRFLPKDVVFVTDIKQRHIQKFLNRMIAAGRKNKTANNYMTIIKSFCRYASENYNVPNPSTSIKKLKEDPPKVNFLSKTQYKLLLKNADSFVRPWVRFIAATGLRASEFTSLKWRDVDFKARTITIIGKGRKQRTVGLNATAMDILNNLRDSNHSNTCVFLSKARKPINRYTLHHYVRVDAFEYVILLFSSISTGETHFTYF